MAKDSKFIIYQDLRGGYRWRLRSATGETLAASELQHAKKQACEEELERCRSGYSDVAILDLTVRRFDG